MKRESGNIILIGLVMIAMVALVGGGLFLYLNVNKTTPTKIASPPSPKQIEDIPISTPSSSAEQPPPLIMASVSAAPKIDTVFGLSTNWQKLIIKFVSGQFDEIASFEYSLTYDTTGTDSARLVKGKIIPDLETVMGNISGKPYFLREIILGSCSQGVCVYDSTPSNFKVTTSIKTF